MVKGRYSCWCYW